MFGVRLNYGGKRAMNKKIISMLLAGTAVMSATANAQRGDAVKVMLNGTQLEFDVPPQIIGERTFVPLRVIFEAMGAEVEWNGDERKIVAVNGDTTVEMIIDNNVMSVNGAVVTLDVPPQIVDDRTLVPARAVAESFGAEVDWDEASRTVIIVSDTVEKEKEEIPAELPAEKTTAEAENFAVSYNRANEIEVDYAYGFKLKSVEQNAEGKYDIEYTFESFKEGSGSISVMFNCLNAEGKVIDTFGGNFVGIDYTWTPQNGTAVIPGETVTIELAVQK